MTDPRAALAEVLSHPPRTQSADWVAEYLAERGVLLVTEERLAAAMIGKYATSTERRHAKRDAAAIFAALSGEVMGVRPKLPAPRKPQP